MSWLDKLENSVFTIITGDGKVYKPLWKSGETSKDFNAIVFEYIDQEGADLKRKKSKARKFPLVFWFSGEDNIEQSEAFDQSSNDNRAWKVSHPFYGDIFGHPLSISRNDTFFNSSEISVDFWETISGTFPRKKISIVDEVSSKAIEYKTTAPIDYSSKTILKPKDLSTVKDNAEKLNAVISSALDSINYSEYQLAKNDMFSKIDNIIAAPEGAIRAINDLIDIPSKFETSVDIRLNLIGNLFDNIKSILGKPTKNNKAYFESAGGAAILALSNTIVNPAPGDYVTRTEISTVAVLLQSYYNQYAELLDRSYLSISDFDNNFSASSGTQVLVKSTVIQTIANLNELAFSAKQERITILQSDSNLILLTHKYMGLDEDDVNIETFRAINNIKNKNLFLLKSGMQIKYYV